MMIGWLFQERKKEKKLWLDTSEIQGEEYLIFWSFYKQQRKYDITYTAGYPNREK